MSFRPHLSSITPAALAHVGLAIATARAGGVGILDVASCEQANLVAISGNLRQFLQSAAPDATVGLRLRAGQVVDSQSLLELLGEHPHWLILAEWKQTDAASLMAKNRQIILEVTDLAQLADLPTDGPIHGLLARGSECIGGSTPAFELARQILEKTDLPVHVQGGIGPQTAAACLAAGAAGIVLDDQLALMPESPLAAAAKTLLSQNPGQTIWPVGQSFGLAGLLTRTYHTTGRLIQAIFAAVENSVRLAQENPAPVFFVPAPASTPDVSALFQPVSSGPVLQQLLATGERRFLLAADPQISSSFTLWETAVQILQRVPKTQGREFHLRLGGPVADARAFAMLSVLTAPLAAMSMKITLENTPDALEIRATGQAWVENLSSPAEPAKKSSPCDIAIVGISVLMPGAHDPETFWKNIINKVNTFQEIPPERWDWRLYYSADRAARDKTNSKWGAFIEEVPFDPLYFGIPPAILKSIEPLQLLALEATRRALADAGYENGGFDKENTAVILGHSGGMSDLGQQYTARNELLRAVGPASKDGFDRLPEWTEESFPGILPNVTSGRVANRFDLSGSNFTVDAACASSLTSLDVATQELESGRCNLAIAGGVDTLMAPGSFMAFGKTNALSSTGFLRTFGEDADGIVIGEGAGIVVLKRLADAERDGDKIYAVIKAVGSSSDGRSATMTAPVSDGQMKAFRRAYDQAGFPISSLGFYEAHGTGTPVGDRIELNSVVKFQARNAGTPKSCATGSVKSLIGHTKASAGVAGVIKTALALHHKVLPPHYGVEKPLKRLRDPKSPLYLLKEAIPWIAAPGQPRRGGISAFGFGGTNFHVVLEEYQGAVQPAAQGGEVWPCELFLWQTTDAAALQQQLTDFQAAIGLETEVPLHDWANSLAANASADWKISLGVVASSVKELLAEIDQVLAELKAPGTVRLGINTTLQSRENIPAETPKIAFLFPGQGSQYVGMGRETALYFSEMPGAWSDGNAAFQGHFAKNLSQFVYPPATFSPEEQKENELQLSETQIAQPGIGILSCGYLDLLQNLGVRADFYAGHSYGEYTALHAAGILSRPVFLYLSGVRGKVMASACDSAPGAMAAVKALREDLLQLLQDDRIVVANHNAPRQTVISGPTEAILAAIAKLEAAKISVRQLPVAGAFHSPLMKNAQGPLSEAIAAAEVTAPTGIVYSNTHARPYENDPVAIKARLSGHMLASVEFVQEIEAIYEAGARIFIEVGPRTVLTGLAREILKEKTDLTAVALDGDRGNLRGLLRSLAQLAAAGVSIDWRPFYERRHCEQVGLTPQSFPAKTKARESSKILVSGGSIRKPGELRGLTGIKPHLTIETSTQTEAIIPFDPPRSEPKAKIMSTNDHLADPLPAATTLPDPAPADGALQAYWTYQETMRQFLKMQEQVMTQFLSGGAPLSVAPMEKPARAPLSRPVTPIAPAKPVAAAPAPAPVTETPKTNGTATPVPAVAVNGNGAKHEGPLDRETLTAELLRLVSERTGYPTEVLGLEQDMESELGIDSIKRVEIFGALQSQLPPSLTSRIPEGGEDFTRVRTLQGWVDALMSLPS